MVILLILLILFHHRDTIPEVYLIFFNLTFYLKLSYWMRTFFCRFYAYTSSPVNYVTL